MAPHYMQATEGQTQRAILDYLLMRGHMVWRNNSGAFAGEYKGKKRFFRFGMKGSADILGVEKGTGRFIAVEVKAKYGKPTPDQYEFLKNIAAIGGISVLAYSIDDVVKAKL